MRMLLSLCLFAVALAIPYEYEPYDVGHKCQPGEKGEVPGIRYFVDAERNEVYPFFYQGCGGEENNRFHTRKESFRRLFMDFSPCPGWSNSVELCGNGRPIQIGEADVGCPEGSFCLNGAFFGKCCSNEIAARYYENQKAICPNSTKGVQTYFDHWKKQQTEFGRNCSHNFCQQGTTCVQGEFEAYCCFN